MKAKNTHTLENYLHSLETKKMVRNIQKKCLNPYRTYIGLEPNSYETNQ